MANLSQTKTGMLGIAAAIAVALLVFSVPVAATATTSNPTPRPLPGEQIVLTSTSGEFWNYSTVASITKTASGTASGTMTLTVVDLPSPMTSAFNFYTLKVTAGSVSLGTTTLGLTGGFALMNYYESFIIGSGKLSGGTFGFFATSLSPTAIPIHPGDFNILSMQIHVGGHYYRVLLHVTTTWVAPVA